MSFPLADPPNDDESCYDLKTNWFEKPGSNYTIDRVFDTEISPSTLLRPEARRIEYVIPPSSFCTDLSQCTLDFCISIVDENGAALPPCSQPTAEVPERAAVAADPSADPPILAQPFQARVPATPGFAGVSLENMVTGTLVKCLDFRINQVSLSPLHNTAPYIAYISTLLNFSSEARGSRLENVGWCDEKDLHNTDYRGYDGFAKRLKWTEDNKYFYCSTALFVGMAMQPRLLIPLTTVNIDLDLCSDEFLLRTSIPNRKFQYRIMKASLNCRRVKLTDSFQAKMEAKLLQNPAVYPQDILNCKTNMISRGQLSFSWTDCFNTFLPNFCIVALIRQDYVSNYLYSPYSFQPNNVSNIQINLDGSVVPSRSFQLNYQSGPTQNWLRAYLSLYRGTTQWDNVSSFIDYERFAQFFTLYLFEFNSSESGWCRDVLPIKRLEPATLNIDFSTDTNDVLKVILFSSSTEIVEITSQRTVLKNFVL